jgi:hypothetical protein
MYVSQHTSSNHGLRRWRVAIVANSDEAAQRGGDSPSTIDH